MRIDTDDSEQISDFAVLSLLGQGDVPKHPTNPTSAVFCGFASLYFTLHRPYQVRFTQPYILKIICSNINDVGLYIKHVGSM